MGVFVNNARETSPSLLAKEALDVVQLHGDESDEDLLFFLTQGLTVIRSLALHPEEDIAKKAVHYQELADQGPGTLALLLDAHAPGVYGGTGETIDWERAGEFISLCAPLPVLLAGGITPNNASEALLQTQPAGLDIASGAESQPGVKDFQKVAALLAATQAVTPS